MRNLFIIALSVVPALAFAKLINPMEFDNSDVQKEEVIQYIKERVKHDYCDGPAQMCQESILRMMEKSNLDAFKEATKATNKKIMDQVIHDYCYSSSNMCNYTTINMMYNKNLEDSNKSLEW